MTHGFRDEAMGGDDAVAAPVGTEERCYWVAIFRWIERANRFVGAAQLLISLLEGHCPDPGHLLILWVLKSRIVY
jgi:hypothetical protein